VKPGPVNKPGPKSKLSPVRSAFNDQTSTVAGSADRFMFAISRLQ
jgi:hypothetical protein